MTENNDIEPRERQNPNWRMVSAERLSACDNRPGLKKIYVTVLDERGDPLWYVKVRFDTEPSAGIVYDHPNWFGTTDVLGRVAWDHLGVSTRYMLYMENDAVPLIENIRTDLGNEYCGAGDLLHPGGWRPVNRPGVYSYRIAIRRRY